jgi:preprotein translocase subunit SecF
MQLFKRTNFDFIGKRYYAFGFSVLLLGVGFASLFAKHGPKLGIDFTGGSLVQFSLKEKLSTSDLRQTLDAGGYRDVEIQDVGEGQSVIIRVPKSAASADTVAHELYGIVKAKFPNALDADEQVAVPRAEYVGPAVGRALADQAVKAIFWASVLIIIYVGFRFKSVVWGFCSIVAVLHDVGSIIGVFSLLNKEITVTVVAGILTLAGYSMNDTIVIYDRMRENLRLSKKETLAEVINRSINETLSRTIMTSLTVAITLLVLFFFGGQVIHDFSFAMLWGVFVGSYSSIFVAAPLIYEWTIRQKKPTLQGRPAVVKK